MKSKEVIDFFGGPAATGKALGITGQAVSQWGDEVPGPRIRTVELAMKLEEESRAKAAKKEAKRLLRKAKEN